MSLSVYSNRSRNIDLVYMVFAKMPYSSPIFLFSSGELDHCVHSITPRHMMEIFIHLSENALSPTANISMHIHDEAVTHTHTHTLEILPKNNKQPELVSLPWRSRVAAGELH